MQKTDETLPRLKLPVQPPIEPMLAQLAREMPMGGGWLYEPKWDGFRALVFWDGETLVIQSRDLRPLGRYFPEVEAALRANLAPGLVVDGEVVIAGADGLDFDALLQRIHPAESRIRLLANRTPASYVAFDLLVDNFEDVQAKPQSERRARLEQRLGAVQPPVYVTPATVDRDLGNQWFERFEGAGLDGVVAKRLDGVYEPGKRAMLKVKHQRTAECVVGGFRWNRGQEGQSVGSLLLGLYDDAGVMHHVGFTSSFSAAQKRELVTVLEPYRDLSQRDYFGEGRGPGGPSRWNRGRANEMDWQPLRPELVCEVAFDHWQGDIPHGGSPEWGGRFRHGTTFQRWRPDKPPAQCTFDQLTFAVPIELAEIFGLSGNRS
ncbi:MAG TPA: ATP-dependent DNA ligase [Chloroflexota bacterium]